MSQGTKFRMSVCKYNIRNEVFGWMNIEWLRLEVLSEHIGWNTCIQRFFNVLKVMSFNDDPTPSNIILSIWYL